MVVLHYENVLGPHSIIPPGVTIIGVCAFCGLLGLKSVTFPGSVTAIETSARRDRLCHNSGRISHKHNHVVRHN